MEGITVHNKLIPHATVVQQTFPKEAKITAVELNNDNRIAIQ